MLSISFLVTTEIHLIVVAISTIRLDLEEVAASVQLEKVRRNKVYMFAVLQAFNLECNESLAGELESHPMIFLDCSVSSFHFCTAIC